MTVWKKVPGLPERYEVSEYGEIRTLDYDTPVKRGGIFRGEHKHIKGRMISPYISRNASGKSRGNPIVSLAGSYTHGARLGEVRLCLLIARAFHGCPYPPADKALCQGWRIRHIDGDLENNRADNLEWVGTVGAVKVEDRHLYEQNIRELARRERELPIEDWLKMIFGDDHKEAAA